MRRFDDNIGANLRLSGISMDDCRTNPDLWDQITCDLSAAELHQLMTSWEFRARPEQLPPTDDFKFWLYLAGRGAGKTRTGAEWTRDRVKAGYNRGGLIAPTAADARDVMVEGESGLLAVCQDWDRDNQGRLMGRPLYEPSKRRVTWENGALVTVYSADEPERLRGPQHDFMWMDELAAWRRMETFDQAMFGLRLGKQPQVFISTTPKPKTLVKKMWKQCVDPADRTAVMTTGSSERNIDNLAPGVIEQLREAYGSTSLGRQELDGVLLEELEGALWNRSMIDGHRLMAMPTVYNPDFYFERIVVSVDPATTSKDSSDETGIIVAALGSDGHGYVLADSSGRYSPAGWAAEVNRLFTVWDADLVVAEVNQGGEMVEHVIHSVNPQLTVRMVHASRGKKARAEPVSQKYEQGKIHHVGTELANLEDQMCTWEFLQTTESPDRVDALVWAIYELMLAGEKPIVTSRLTGFF